MLPDTIQVPVKITGNLTEKNFEGVFTIKVKMSTRDNLALDRTYREIVGGSDPFAAGDQAMMIGNALAWMRVRTIKAPEFWTLANGGFDFEDDNVLTEVFAACSKAVGEEYAKLAKAAEEAKKHLSTSTT